MLSDQIREDGCSAESTNFALLNSTTPNGPFKDTFGSLIKVYVMMIGEFEYEGMIILVLTERLYAELLDLIDYENDTFVGYTAFIFIVFVIIMSIIIMNLLTGLAVDDIQSIAENAELKKLSMQVCREKEPGQSILKPFL